jgi:pentatricopeptide repeat protein
MDQALNLCHSLATYNIEANEAFYNNLLEGCAKNVCIDMAFSVFDVMEAKSLKATVVTYNSLIEACVGVNQLNKAWEILDHMKTQGVQPDRYSYCFLFKGIRNPGHKTHLSKALNLTLSWDVNGNSQQMYQHKFCYNVLLNACINCNEMGKALELLEKMNSGDDEAKPDEVSHLKA